MISRFAIAEVLVAIQKAEHSRNCKRCWWVTCTQISWFFKKFPSGCTLLCFLFSFFFFFQLIFSSLSLAISQDGRMSRIASKQIVTNQNYTLVLWPLSAVDNWLGILSQRVYSQSGYIWISCVSMCRQQLGDATTHSGWSISSIRSKCVCLCNLNLELHVTLKVGYIPCIFIFL